MTPLALLEQCAPLVAPVTMAAIVQQESGGNPLAIHDNTTGTTLRPATVGQAQAVARERIAQGHSVDLGIAQINSGNLPALGMSSDDMFVPCTNLRAAQAVLLSSWKQSKGDLAGALSAWNTGRVNSSVGARYAAAVYARVSTAAPVVPPIPGARMAAWTLSSADAGASPDSPTGFDAPLRPVVSWSPQASPLVPQHDDLLVSPQR